MKDRPKPPGKGVSRRKEPRIFIRSDRAAARLRLLTRGGRSKVDVIEEALDAMVSAEVAAVVQSSPCTGEPALVRAPPLR